MNLLCFKCLIKWSGTISKKYYDKVKPIVVLIDYETSKCQYIFQMKRFYSEVFECASFQQFEEVSYAISNYNAITHGNPEKKKLLQLYQAEIDMLQKQGKKIPSNLSVSQWKQLLLLETRNKRLRYLQNLWIREQNKKVKNQEKLNMYIDRIETIEKLRKEKNNLKQFTNTPLIYNIQFNTIFNRINCSKIGSFYNFKLLQAFMFCPEILIDMDFEEDMSTWELSRCASQIHKMWNKNKLFTYPFNLVFCNVKSDSGKLMSKLKVRFAHFNNPEFPFMYTNKSYLDLYPKEKLIYLTPEGDESLTEYDPDYIYILGTLCSNAKNDVMFRTIQNDIRTMRFPIDEYLCWKGGSRSLELSECIGIMNDLKKGATWAHAFRHIPIWKTSTDIIQIYEGNKKKTITPHFIKELYKRNRVYDILMEEKNHENKYC